MASEEPRTKVVSFEFFVDEDWVGQSQIATLETLSTLSKDMDNEIWDLIYEALEVELENRPDEEDHG